MRYPVALMTAAALCTGASQALAQQDPDAWDPWEKWSISGGAFIADLDNTVRIGPPGAGLEFDLEEALGMKNSQTVFRFDGSYRMGTDNRHRIDFTWFDLSRDATRTLQEEIEIDGIVYPVGTTVNSEFDLAFYNVRYAYSFIKDDRIDYDQLRLVKSADQLVTTTRRLVGAAFNVAGLAPATTALDGVVAARRQGDLAEAAKQVRDVVATHRDDLEARMLEAETLAEVGNTEEAATKFEALAVELPDDPEVKGWQQRLQRRQRQRPSRRERLAG